MNRWVTILSGYQLSILRIFLTFFAGRECLQHITIIYNFRDNSPDIFYPTWFMNLLPGQWLILNSEHAIFLKGLVIVLMGGAMLGLLGRVCLLSLAVVLFYVFGFNYAYGIFDHHNSLSSQVLFILALIPGSMALSADRFILGLVSEKKMKFRAMVSPPNLAWGFNLVLIIVSITYFSSGFSKLRFGGLSWMDGKTLGFYLSLDISNANSEGLNQLIIGSAEVEKTKWKDKFGLHAHIYGNQHRGRLQGFGRWLASHKLLIGLVSAMTLLFELSSPVMFINNRWRTWYLLGAILMHTTIGALMGLPFTQYRIICFCLMDWKYLQMFIQKNLPFRFKIVLKENDVVKN